jgi:hypothetical protein
MYHGIKFHALKTALNISVFNFGTDYEGLRVPLILLASQSSAGIVPF